MRRQGRLLHIAVQFRFATARAIRTHSDNLREAAVELLQQAGGPELLSTRGPICGILPSLPHAVELLMIDVIFICAHSRQHPSIPLALRYRSLVDMGHNLALDAWVQARWCCAPLHDCQGVV